ncbi:hypothetical protein GQ457_15G028330 [Hibiscus cannabinus]
MGSTVPESYVSSMEPRLRGGCSADAKVLDRENSGGGVSRFCLWFCFSFVSLRRLVFQAVVGCDAAGSVFSLRVAPNESRPLLSKALWRLVFVGLAFTGLGANDGTLGIVAKTPVSDPLSVQVYGAFLQPQASF